MIKLLNDSVKKCSIEFLASAIAFGLRVQNFCNFIRVWNSAIKFWTMQKKKCEITKLSKMGPNYGSLLPNIVKFCYISVNISAIVSQCVWHCQSFLALPNICR